MGASLSCREERLPPLAVEGAPLTGISYELPIASAQVKSCLLFAGLLAEGETRVVEPLPSRDHSERMLSAAGADVRREQGAVAIAAPESPARRPDRRPRRLLLGRLLPGRRAARPRQRRDPDRGRPQPDPHRAARRSSSGWAPRSRPRSRATAAASPPGPVRARASALRGTEVGGAEVPLAIDELPLVALAACFAEGTTTISDAAELRRKESDRIATVAAALTRARGDGRDRPRTGCGSRGRRPARRRGRLARRPPDRDAGGDRRPRLRATGSRSPAWTRPAISYPGFEADLASLTDEPARADQLDVTAGSARARRSSSSTAASPAPS